MAKKTYCDRCKAEIQRGIEYQLKVYGRQPSCPGGWVYWDLCSKCYNEFLKFITGEVKK